MKFPSKVSLLAKLIPYKIPILIGIGVIAFTVIFGMGMRLQARFDDGALARKDVIIKEGEGKLKQAAMVIEGANKALLAQKEANRLALEDERKSKQAAIDAGAVVERARYQAQKSANSLQKQLDTAKKIDVCKILLTTDVSKVCKI